MPRGVRLYVTSAGNAVMIELAALFAEGFEADGVPAEVAVDAVPEGRDWREVIVAPHEYFPLFFLRHRPTIELAPTLARAWVLCTEQPGSRWFAASLEYARHARGVFDVSPAAVRALRRHGIPAIHAPLGVSPARAPLPCPPQADRTIDILFMGRRSPRRDAFFAKNAELFSRLNCRLLLADVTLPRGQATAGYLEGTGRDALVRDSRILLNIHASERTYFEQHRAVLAIAGGCVLVTETSRDLAPLEPGRDLAMARLHELPALCSRLLEDPAARQAMVDSARAKAEGAFTIRRGTRAMLEAWDGERPARVALTQARAQRPDTVHRPSGEQTWTVTGNDHARSADAPAVSVIVTLFNYSRVVERCLRSLESAGPIAGGLEVIVVDDASTDGSAEVVERLMREWELPTRLVRMASNTGLAAARNTGLALARGPAVFVLDADNWVLPSGLRVLHDAYVNGQYAAVYGIIARVDEESGEPDGLLSCGAWSERDLVRAPYIDAMALFDAAALREVGGYSTDLVEHGPPGWEDYDVWLKLAAAGRTCLHVPRLVAGYREHAASMLNSVAGGRDGLAKHFRQKFAALVARHPGLDMYFGYAAETPPFETEEMRELRRLREHAGKLEQRIAELESSASWRITAPLRQIAALLRRRA
ncbi:MAG TPA: glycosyltransferase [Vicinamibacterales bacterium]